MERGRSGWTSTFKGEAVALPQGDPWERFRIGPAGSWNDDKSKRATYPGTQFPIDAYDQFMKQGVPRWLTTDDQIVAAYIALVDKVCPCVVMVHSQSGSFGYKVLEARPDKVKALVAVEPTLGGDRNKVASIKNTPILVVYGDNAKDHPRWSKIRQGGVDYAAALKAAGGSIDIVDLPDAGIRGNSHMVMMDRNSDQVADLIQKWLVGKGSRGMRLRCGATCRGALGDSFRIRIAIKSTRRTGAAPHTIGSLCLLHTILAERSMPIIGRGIGERALSSAQP